MSSLKEFLEDDPLDCEGVSINIFLEEDFDFEGVLDEKIKY